MKAVFFDFDGTLTYTGPNIWQEIWLALGFSLGKDSEHQKQLDEFLSKKITYQEWCDKTLACYMEKNMTKEVLNTVASRIKLLPGATETFKELRNRGYELFIISGNIIDVIECVLGDNKKYFNSINANDFVFDSNNKLTYIKGTEYDCEGKAKFIQEYIGKTNARAKDLYFVGNGFNDEWAYLTGCRTICINPDDADFKNTKLWHTTLKTESLTDLLKFIK